MSLYDDIDTDKKSDNVAGWASGIKFMQSHMHLKKKALPQPKREVRKQHLTPVVAFKKTTTPADGDDPSTGPSTTSTPSFILPYSISVSKKRGGAPKSFSTFIAVDPEWQFENEYDPFYPNEYEKALKDLRERRDREAEEEEAKRKDSLTDDIRLDEDNPGGNSGTGGVAIAPPASLNLVNQDYDDDDKPFSMADISPSSSNKGFGGLGKPAGSSFGLGPGSGAFAAAKIMAKYGYKEGQGLGRMEQGMSTALQVEKTSHRIGRIIHEKDLPKEGVVSLIGTPPNLAGSYMDDDEFEMEPPQNQNTEEGANASAASALKMEQEAEEQLKNPSKVVLLSNMVGPGDVDDDLEPEVKEECQKYGEVVAVIVFQMPDVDSEDSIRIFVEFVQVGSAVKAFLDLNGRYFGGRQVRASFYDPEKFNNLELTL